MITLSDKEWATLVTTLTEEHGHSTLLLRNKCKETLGFTLRFGAYGDQYPRRDVHLDFFDDTKETWFRMKYL